MADMIKKSIFKIRSIIIITIDRRKLSNYFETEDSKIKSFSIVTKKKLLAEKPVCIFQSNMLYEEVKSNPFVFLAGSATPWRFCSALPRTPRPVPCSWWRTSRSTSTPSCTPCPRPGPSSTSGSRRWASSGRWSRPTSRSGNSNSSNRGSSSSRARRS